MVVQKLGLDMINLQVHRIWSLYIRPLCRYDRQCKM